MTGDLGLHPGWGALAPPPSDAVALALDLTTWFAGGAPSGALAATLVEIAGARELGVRRVTTGRPALAAAAGVALTVELWPALCAPSEGASEAAEPESPADRGVGGLASAVADAMPAVEARVVATGGLLEDLDRLGPGGGVGKTPGTWERALLGAPGRMATLLEQAAAVRALADALGRGERRARRTATAGPVEVTGVRAGGEVERALAGELALLADPATEDLFFARVAERSLWTLELGGSDLEAKGSGERGPVVVCLDTSGSMAGAPEVAAKALVLALARRVLRQGRSFAVMLFGASRELTTLQVSRSYAGLDAILELLAWRFGGGTDFDVPLIAALDAVHGRVVGADVLFVTDGFARASPSVAQRVAAARRDGVRVTAVLVGEGGTGAALHDFADRVLRLGGPTDAPELCALFRDPGASSSHRS